MASPIRAYRQALSRGYLEVYKSVETKLVAGHVVTNEDFNGYSPQRIGHILKMLRDAEYDVLTISRLKKSIGWCLASTVLNEDQSNPKGK